MSSGKAYGKDRDYQVLCRDVLKRISADPLEPYDGDGIDVTIYDVGGTKITFDVALRGPTGDLVVAECRRRKEVVKQEAMFAFARKVELLRQHTGRRVAGVFFAKRQFQVGAVRHGNWTGFQLAIIAQDQDIKGFSLAYQKYDASRSKRLQEAIVNLSGEVTPKGSLSLVVIRKDGKVEHIGDLK
jgi:hypothetical protein